MGRKKRRQFTPEELKQLKAYAAIRLPTEQQAALFGLSEVWFLQMVKDSEAAQLSVAEGRASASAKARSSAYMNAVGRKGEKDARGNPLPDIIPTQRGLEFWLRTQEDFKFKDRLELTGKDGEPLDKLSKEQLDEKFDKTFKRLGARAALRRTNGPDDKP